MTTLTPWLQSPDRETYPVVPVFSHQIRLLLVVRKQSGKKDNDRLREREYVKEGFWKDLFGKDVSELWEDYSKTFFDDMSKGDSAKGDEKPKENEEADEEEQEDMVLVERHGEE